MGEAKRRRERDPNYGRSRFVDLRPDQSSSAFDNLPPGTTADDYLNYLDRNWDLMAGFAYDSYLREGRGPLILDWDLSLDRRLSLLSPELRRSNQFNRATVDRGELNCPIFYLGARSPLTRALGDWFTPNMQRLIGRYDPETMIVLFLCWGTDTDAAGLMGRTLAAPSGASTPKRLYVESIDRQREFAFLAGSDKAPTPPPQSRIVRAFLAELETSPEFRRSLKAVFLEGVQKHGKGAIIAIPTPAGDGIMPKFFPASDVPNVLGTDVKSRPWQQAQAIIDMCNPENQVAAISVSEGFRSGENFTYYSCLLNIPEST